MSQTMIYIGLGLVVFGAVRSMLRTFDAHEAPTEVDEEEETLP